MTGAAAAAACRPLQQQRQHTKSAIRMLQALVFARASGQGTDRQEAGDRPERCSMAAWQTTRKAVGCM